MQDIPEFPIDLGYLRVKYGIQVEKSVFLV